MPDWETVLHEHGAAVWQTAYRLLANRADADDCFQETFANALRFTQRGKPIKHWRAFLVRLAIARSLDRLRHRYRHGGRERLSDDMQEHHGRGRPPDELAADAEQLEQLRQTISRLPLKQADAFCLHHIEGWSYREIAESTGTTTDHVGVLISRARATLRERIAASLTKDALHRLSPQNKVSP